MTAPVEICSNALLLVGHAPIASLEDGSDRANLMANLYNQVRRSTIRGHVWNFAKHTELLSPDATTPPIEWSYRFLKPGDFLRFLWIGERGESYDYDLQGEHVLFDEESLPLTYLRDIVDPNKFDSSFVDALTARLAFTAAWPLTKSLDLQKAMWAAYQTIKVEAEQINGQEIPPGEISGSPLLNARRRRG